MGRAAVIGRLLARWGQLGSVRLWGRDKRPDRAGRPPARLESRRARLEGHRVVKQGSCRARLAKPPGKLQGGRDRAVIRLAV